MAFGDLKRHCESNDSNCTFRLDQKKYNHTSRKKKEFNSIFKKENVNNFKNPNIFEKNYSIYFDFKNKQDKDINFEFYDDKDQNRYLHIFNLLCYKNILGKLTIYYGLPGMGKSITLIKAFKYEYDHSKFGTLYINCKFLNKSYMNHFQKMQDILKDEIVYLFENEYNSYIKCADIIDKLDKNNMDDSFWNIIISIIKKFCINKNKKYIFIFDQYKNEFDNNQKLYDLNEYLKNLKNKEQYGIIACCSMNNKSVRKLKVENLFERVTTSDNADNIKIKEIKYLFDISHLKIDEKGIYEYTLEKLGKNIKNFIIIRDLFNNRNYKGLLDFVAESKSKIRENLIQFFNLNNDSFTKSEGQPLIHFLNPILSFTVDTEYEIDYIKKIRDFIPFKYFDIQDTRKNYCKIIFNFPLVGEAMTEVYEKIIYASKSIYSIFNDIGLDQGALGGLFEKYVIYTMEPDINKNCKILFNYFKIKEVEIVDKFVPKENENYMIKDIEIKNLNDGDYLFKQKQFNGKAFDCAIFRITNGDAMVFLFQISINKEKIYTIDQLLKYILIFIDYFSYRYKFKIRRENVYFTYIFDVKNKNELNEKCKENGVKCMFFNPSIKKFHDFDNYEFHRIKDPTEMFSNPYSEKYGQNDIIMKDMTKIYNNGKKVFMKKKQKISIETFWKKLYPELNNKKLNLYYSHNINELDLSYLNKANMYLRELKGMEVTDFIKSIDESKKDKLSTDEYKEEILFQKEKNKTLLEFQTENNYVNSDKKILLLIYKTKDLNFNIILDNGIIKTLRNIPIIKNSGIKSYDVYYISEKK